MVVNGNGFQNLTVHIMNFAQVVPGFAHDAAVVESLLTVSSTQFLSSTWKQ